VAPSIQIAKFNFANTNRVTSPKGFPLYGNIMRARTLHTIEKYAAVSRVPYSSASAVSAVAQKPRAYLPVCYDQ
jgi:hypothetical protein